NVCAIYDLGTHEGAPFVVMELLEGETLREHLQGGPLPLRKAMSYAAEAAEGLAAAHAKGIVHRDLKPENLFITRDGRVKVLDFGLAKLTGGEAAAAPIAGSADAVSPSSPTTPPLKLTTPGVILGTIAYMSPEQVRGAAVDARADVFALGVVLFEMLTGRRPFGGTSSADVMSAILNQEVAPLGTMRPDAPAQLSWLVRRCLAKDPDRRVQTSLDVRNELEDLLDELDRGTSPDATTARKTSEPVERQFPLTAAHVRRLSNRTPRLIGYPLRFIDNRNESETLVVCLHGVGGDHRRFEQAVRTLPYRAVAVSLAGFAAADTYRPVLSFDDHSELLRILLADLARECRPTRTILVGFSAGADQFLRMIESPEGAGVEVAGLVALGTNVSLETCFVSSLFAKMDVRNPEGILEALKALGAGRRTLASWLLLQTYITQTFTKFGSELESLVRYSAELVAPFEGGGDPLPGWYRAAAERIPSVRFVFSDGEAGPAEAVLARHLEQNVLGDRFAEKTWVTEPVAHAQLTEPRIVNRYVESVIAELG
ncbi:MAG TPA: alpha/beta fold hydrolase, partial [Candidatus Eisenbacteria bacterium]|nr:alpha/beta fold hydrolase [Candidatus Eisenbacteria bacterium]